MKISLCVLACCSMTTLCGIQYTLEQPTMLIANLKKLKEIIADEKVYQGKQIRLAPAVFGELLKKSTALSYDVQSTYAMLEALKSTEYEDFSQSLIAALKKPDNGQPEQGIITKLLMKTCSYEQGEKNKFDLDKQRLVMQSMLLTERLRKSELVNYSCSLVSALLGFIMIGFLTTTAISSGEC